MRSVIFICLMMLAGPALAEDAPQITVNGQGSISAVPDLATITLGVTREAPEASTALNDTSRAAQAIFAVLNDQGLEPRDVQTQGVELSPVWSNYRDGSESGRPRVVGFRASNRITARVRDLERLGGVLDAVVKNGANEIQGLNFAVVDQDELSQQARALAVKDARARAMVLAKAAGGTLGRVLSIVEGGGGYGGPVRMEMAARSADVPIAAGEVSTDVRVTVVFEYIN